jgi:hypothetical protein
MRNAGNFLHKNFLSHKLSLKNFFTALTSLKSDYYTIHYTIEDNGIIWRSYSEFR